MEAVDKSAYKIDWTASLKKYEGFDLSIDYKHRNDDGG